MPELRRTIRRPRPAEEYEEEDRPRLRRREEPPTQSRRSSRPADDDDDLKVGTVSSGWGGYKRTKAAAPSRWTKMYKVEDDEQLIFFLEDAPYASFLQHWADWMPRGHKMSYVCLRPEECPLCEVQDPSARVRFNIMNMAAEPPLLETLETGITIAQTLEDDIGDNGLAGTYWAIAMKGPKKNKRTQIRPVKKRDLQEDWKVDPLTDSEIEEWCKKCWDEEAVEKSTRAELQEVADESAK